MPQVQQMYQDHLHLQQHLQHMLTRLGGETNKRRFCNMGKTRQSKQMRDFSEGAWLRDSYISISSLCRGSGCRGIIRGNRGVAECGGGSRRGLRWVDSTDLQFFKDSCWWWIVAQGWQRSWRSVWPGQEVRWVLTCTAVEWPRTKVGGTSWWWYITLTEGRKDERRGEEKISTTMPASRVWNTVW